MDYSVEAKHEYAIGTLEQIKRGVDVPKTFDLDATVSSFREQAREGSSSPVLIPKIIGAYRRIKFTFSNPECSGKTLEKRVDISDKTTFDVHPSLVQIGYDQTVINKAVVSAYMGAESSRMIIVPYQDLKSEGKDMEDLSQLMTQSFERQLRLKQITREERLEWLTLMRQLLTSEGLAKNEYEALMSSSGAVLL